MAEFAQLVDLFAGAGYRLPQTDNILAGGKVTAYASGTLTDKTVWTDRAKTTPAAQPFILGADGRAEVYGDGVYDFVITTSADVPVETIPGAEYKSVSAITDAFASAVVHVETIQAVRDYTGSATVLQPLGYWAENDGGGGPVREKVTVGGYVDNGGSILVVSGSGGAEAFVTGDELTLSLEWGTKTTNTAAVNDPIILAAVQLNVSKTLDVTGVAYTSQELPSGYELVDRTVRDAATGFAAPAIVDMHFGSLKGSGWVTGDPGGIVPWTVSSGVAAGATSITFDSVTNTVVNQLITLKSPDDLYQTAVIDTIVGNTLTFKSPLDYAVDAGQNAWNFYNNEPHPNQYGYYAIADYAIEEAGYVDEFYGIFAAEDINNAVLTAYAADITANPGSSNAPSTQVVTTIDAGSGVTYKLGESIPAGVYTAKLSVNGNGNTLTVEVVNNSGTLIVYKDDAYTDNGVTTIDIPVFIPAGDLELNVYLTTPAATETFYVGDCSLVSRNSALALDRGTHVLLGDSWFDFDFLPERIAERLPHATIINQGVGGNTGEDLSNRFDTDVTPYNPDYVWLMTGTNEYFSSIAQDVYSFYINKLKNQTAEIGAQAIIFTPSVGSADLSATRFDLSRQYAKNTLFYAGQVLAGVSTGVVAYQTISVPTTVIANGDSISFGFIGRVDGQVSILASYFDHVVTVEESQGLPPQASATIDTLATGFQDVSSISQTSAVRFVYFKYSNASGGPITFTGYLYVSANAF